MALNQGDSTAFPKTFIKTYCVKGISHHDVADRLGVWLPKCMGMMVTPRIEQAEDNEIGVECIAVYRVDEHLGYINDDDKQEVKRLLQHCQRMPRGRIVGYGEGDGEKHGYRHAWLRVEITFVVSEEETSPEAKVETLPSPWDNWSYEGTLLPQSPSELKLDQVMNVLCEMVRYNEPWSDEVQAYTTALCRHGAFDLSVEMRRELSAIRLWLEQMPEKEAQACMHEVLNLQNNMGSLECRQLHAQRLLIDKMMSAGCMSLHQSGQIDLAYLAERIATMPYHPTRSDMGGQYFVGKLYYDLLTRKKLRQILSVVALYMWHEEPTEQQGSPAAAEASGEEVEPFRFIRPEIPEEEERQIHRSVRRLVTRFGVQEICAYLKELCAQKKIMLPQSVQVAYDELARMGMPVNEKGFDYKTFAKYYNK